jgi:hypothetical protein
VTVSALCQCILAAEFGLTHVASTEGCNILETVERKDFVDQSGTVKPPDRFTGGSGKNPERRHTSLKAIDPRRPAKPRPP